MNAIPTHRVLMIDDEPRVLLAYKCTLGKKFDVTCVEGARAALSLIGSGETFSVIVTDMRMPGMTGLEFILAARPKTPESTFIVLTGNTDPQTEADAIIKGRVFRFLTKPCMFEPLCDAIKAGMSRYERVVAKLVQDEKCDGPCIASISG